MMGKRSLSAVPSARSSLGPPVLKLERGIHSSTTAAVVTRSLLFELLCTFVEYILHLSSTFVDVKLMMWFTFV